MRAFLGPWGTRLETLLAHHPEGRGPKSSLLGLARIHYFAYREFLRNICLERAATLSFVTLLSLIPLTVLFLSFVGAFWAEENLKTFVRTKLLFFLIPDASLRETIWSLVDGEIRSTAFQLQAGVSLVAVVVLLVSSAGLLVSAERVFNRLWEVTTSRTYIQKLRIFWIILTTSPVALGISLYFDQVTRQGTVLGALKDRYWILEALYSFFLPALVSFLGFTLLNMILPNARVRILPAILGGCVTAVLWEAAKNGFYFYIRQSQNYSSFYGSLGILPVFFLWIYITWIVVLYGAEVARVAQTPRRFPDPARQRKPAPAPSSPFHAVYLLDRVYDAFERGAPLPSLETIAGEIGLRAETLEPIAAELVKGGILAEDRGSPGRFAPLRAPELVRVREVVEALTLPHGPLLGDERALDFAGPDSGRRVFRLFQGARTAFLGSMGDQTMRDLIANSLESRN